jgi:hypothetical protein
MNQTNEPGTSSGFPWKLEFSPNLVRSNDSVTLTLTPQQELPPGIRLSDFDYRFTAATNADLQNTINNAKLQLVDTPSPEVKGTFRFPDIAKGDYLVFATITREDPSKEDGNGKTGDTKIECVSDIQRVDASVHLQRAAVPELSDMALGPAIRNRTAAIGFERYQKFIGLVFDDKREDNPFNYARERLTDTVPRNYRQQKPRERTLSIFGPYAYEILKLATQVFITLESGVVIEDDDGKPKIFDIDKERIRFDDPSLTFESLNRQLREYLGGEPGSLPYLKRILNNLITLNGDNREKEVLPYFEGVLQFRLTQPSLMELIWSYWLEEGMLVQTINAIALRFQNRRASPRDPLGEMEFDPLRPLSNLLWGYVQDEHRRLTVPQRASEYMHKYGMPLIGRGVTGMQPADVRSKFIEGFHNLLSCAARFYKEDSDTTVIADGFPLLNALKEVHLLIAEGAGNQGYDLTWTARAEMMTIQWMLARPEMGEFLRGRYMVPYQERWMGAVDSMKKLQGWTDTSVSHFHELAITGERILLSIRYADWSDIELIQEQAKTWARSWKPEVQRYMHAYRTATGVDLSAEPTDSRDGSTRYLPPSILLQRRLEEQVAGPALPAPRRRPALPAQPVSSLVELPPRAAARLAAPNYRGEP